jgi:hypothetical protein
MRGLAMELQDAVRLAASPLDQGERIEVRGFEMVPELSTSTLTLPLSLAKGEASLARILR